MNGFYQRKEEELALRVQELSKLLKQPESWLMTPVPQVGDVSLAAVVSLLQPGNHADEAHLAALNDFVKVCEEIDSLRKFSVFNYLAVTKIVKKHDKLSLLTLQSGVTNYVAQQPFYTSTLLASTFTHAQCIASEVIASATDSSVTMQSSEYTCSICLEVLNMPVVLSCAHRFCYGCLSTASFYDHHCPLCKKETDLDPANYHIDPILTRFVKTHFVEGDQEVSPTSCKPCLVPASSAPTSPTATGPVLTTATKGLSAPAATTKDIIF